MILNKFIHVKITEYNKNRQQKSLINLWKTAHQSDKATLKIYRQTAVTQRSQSLTDVKKVNFVDVPIGELNSNVIKS